MKLSAYFDQLTPEEKIKFAEQLDYNLPYIQQVATGPRNPSAKLCKKIERLTTKWDASKMLCNGIVTRYDLRPDLFDKPKRNKK